MMTSQQSVFSHVVTFLRAQGQQSLSGFSAVIRDPSGNRCAMGCLIHSQLLDENPGFCGARTLSDVSPLIRESGVNVRPTDVYRLVKRLVAIHDNYHPSAWENRFAKLAAQLGLKMP